MASERSAGLHKAQIYTYLVSSVYQKTHKAMRTKAISLQGVPNMGGAVAKGKKDASFIGAKEYNAKDIAVIDHKTNQLLFVLQADASKNAKPGFIGHHMAMKIGKLALLAAVAAWLAAQAFIG